MVRVPSHFFFAKFTEHIVKGSQDKLESGRIEGSMTPGYKVDKLKRCRMAGAMNHQSFHFLHSLK